jgi:hypothetical protein
MEGKYEELKTTSKIMMQSGSEKMKKYGNSLHNSLKLMSPSEEDLNSLVANTLVYYKKKSGEIRNAYVNPKQGSVSPEVVSLVTSKTNESSVNEAFAILKKSIINIGGYKSAVKMCAYYAALSPIIISIASYKIGEAILTPILTSAIEASQKIAGAVKESGKDLKDGIEQGYNESRLLSFAKFKNI